MTRQEEPGARWLRCDLHVHTPFDGEKDFGVDVRGAIEALKKANASRIAEIAQNFVQACQDAGEGEGLDVVALTDHNSIDGYRRLKPQFDTIAQQAGGQHVPTILPGVEFSVGGERPLHFLVIFSTDTSSDAIEGAINYVFGEHDRFDRETGTPRATGNSVNEFLKKLYQFCRPSSGERNLSFVIIPAHADSDRGAEKETQSGGDVSASIWEEMRGHLRQWVVTRQDWHGFQTRRPYKKLSRAFQDLLGRWVVARHNQEWDQLTEDERRKVRNKEHWPLIEASDPNRYEKIGSRFTWLKMEVPDVEGIRLALLDPESRLRRMDHGKPPRNYPVIKKLRISHTDFIEDVELPLNPCLNTLIGGRGTGKSTALECIRYALDRARQEEFADDENEIYEVVEGFLQGKKTRDFGQSPGMLLPEHEVTLDIEISGRDYRIIRSTNNINVYQEDGPDNWEAVPLDVRALIQPRILSQGQIARIARDRAAQRREIDALIDREFIESFEERNRRTLDELQELQTRRQQLKYRAETLPAKRTELQKVKDQVKFLEREGNQETLSQFEIYKKEEEWLKKVKRSIDQAADSVDQNKRTVQEIRQQVADPPDRPSSEWTQTVARRGREALTSVETHCEQHKSKLDQLQRTLDQEKQDQWNPSFNKIHEAYTQLKEEMEQRGVDFKQHQKLLERRSQLEQEVQELEGIEEELNKVEAQIDTTRNSLIRLHEERLEKRVEVARSLEEQDADVRIECIGFRDRGDAENSREAWFGGSGIQERDWSLFVDYIFEQGGTVSERLKKLSVAFRNDINYCQRHKKKLTPAESELAKLLGEAGKQLTKTFFNALSKPNRIDVDAIERFLPDDRINARVRATEGEFKPIDQGSVGLKSTAILSLLLSAGEQPLVIDQPEEDLDNQYVYNTVVDLLKKRKFSRQILIATHNANIPVNGDAEMIVALGVEQSFGKTIGAGSIDSRTVKELVSRIMEGSAEAFQLRQQRYGF